MTDDARNLAVFVASSKDELAGQHPPRSAAPYQRWAERAAHRWPSLPSWDPPENSDAQPLRPA